MRGSETLPPGAGRHRGGGGLMLLMWCLRDKANMAADKWYTGGWGNEMNGARADKTPLPAEVNYSDLELPCMCCFRSSFVLSEISPRVQKYEIKLVFS